MTIRMKYENEYSWTKIEIDYQITQVCLVQKDKERDTLDVVSIYDHQCRDLYKLLKEIYE